MKPENDNQPPRLWPKLLDAAVFLLGWLIFLAPVWFVIRGFLEVIPEGLPEAKRDSAL
ncbi:MAG: hypothetical protein HWE30_17620 [Methylocystaceae bacterium]|nr:hypothetical protein [Methylocystaceae bacterium]